MNCVLCRPFSWLRKNLRGRCVADRPELQQEFIKWRKGQARRDAKLFENDPQKDAINTAFSLYQTDPVAAFSQLLAFAEGGSAFSMVSVGTFYKMGIGVDINPGQAEHWYRVAEECGSQLASHYLVELYREQGDLDKCESVLQTAVAEHWAPALFDLAVIKLEQPKTQARRDEARMLLEEASALGDIGAQWYLGRRMTHGMFGWRYIRRGFRLTMDACKKSLALLERKSKPSQQTTIAV